MALKKSSPAVLMVIDHHCRNDHAFELCTQCIWMHWYWYL